MSEPDKGLPPSPSFVASLMGRANEYAVAATVCVYLLGFVITTMYFGSLGVVSFDVLRIRHILVGLLFLLFCASFVVPLWRLLISFRSAPTFTFRALVPRLLWNTYYGYGAIYLATVLLRVLAGEPGEPPIHLPDVDTEAGWYSFKLNFWTTWWTRILQIVPWVALLIVGVVVLVLLVATAINATLRLRGKTVPKAQPWRAWEGSLGVISLIGLIVIGIPAVETLIFLGRNASTRLMGQPVNFDDGWIRFTLGSFCVYVLIALYLMAMLVLREPPIEADDEEDEPTAPVDLHFGRLMLLSMLGGVLVPLYSLNIFPFLPPQVGGGAVLPVQVTLNAEKGEPAPWSGSDRLYLIDRSESRVLLLVMDQPRTVGRVVEFSQDMIRILQHGTTADGGAPPNR